MGRARIALVLAGALSLGGCVTSRVLTSEPDATIWFDGRPVKDGKVHALGPPHTARVLAIAKDGRRGRALVNRQFTWLTFVGGLRTLGVCFLFCWQYPDVYVELPPARAVTRWEGAPGGDPWALGTSDSEWMRAPGGAPTATSTSTSTSTSTATSTPVPSAHPERSGRAAAAESKGTPTRTPSSTSRTPGGLR